MRLGRAAIVGAVVVGFGCGEPVVATVTAQSAPSAAPAPAPSAAPAPAPAPAPSPSSSPSPSPIPLLKAEAHDPTSGPVPLKPAEESIVESTSRFEVAVAAVLPDARLVLVDAADAYVAGAEVREVGATTRLELTPAAPLRPGSRYVLRVEGGDGRAVRDRGGAIFLPASMPLVVAGTPPPPEPEKKPAKRRRR